MPSSVRKRQKNSEDVEIAREEKEMENRPFRVERQKESKDGNCLKSSIPQETGCENKIMWYVALYSYLFLQTKPNKYQHMLVFKKFLFLFLSK